MFCYDIQDTPACVRPADCRLDSLIADEREHNCIVNSLHELESGGLQISTKLIVRSHLSGLIRSCSQTICSFFDTDYSSYVNNRTLLIFLRQLTMKDDVVGNRGRNGKSCSRSSELRLSPVKVFTHDDLQEWCRSTGRLIARQRYRSLRSHRWSCPFHKGHRLWRPAAQFLWLRRLDYTYRRARMVSGMNVITMPIPNGRNSEKCWHLTRDFQIGYAIMIWKINGHLLFF